MVTFQATEKISPAAFGLDRAAYSISDSSRVLSVSRPTLYRLIKAGKLNPAKLGSKTLN
jgi:excisionase family DNA binding protein